MDISIFSGKVLSYTGDLLVLGRFQDETVAAFETEVDQALGGALSKKATRQLFKGKSGQSVSLDSTGRIAAERILLIGLGKRSDFKGRSIRDRSAEVAREALASRSQTVAMMIADGLDTESTSEILLGFELGLYRFDAHQTPNEETPRAEVKSLAIAGSLGDQERHRAQSLANAVNLARTLVNEPPNICTPTRLADVALGLSSDQIKVAILDKEEIYARKMGGVIAVSQGATEEPKFIHVHYRPKGESRGSVALIGKGLTFDSGGLSLKPPKAQEFMHIDMGGAAAVLGAMTAISELKPDIEVHGIVGACENMPDGNSFRPSDILTMYSKKTVEVLNTDAEGRLVLADALHYATDLKPDAMVNLATLTGACMVGLGNNYCGLFSDNDQWAAQLESAAKAAGEKAWRLPLDEGLAGTLKSKRADIRNIGGPYGGAITAALFLKNFKGDCTWGHLDIAGPTLSDKAVGSVPVGGTGFGVLTLVSLVERFKKA